MATSDPLLLALDAGTTGNRALVFDSRLRVVASAYREFGQSFPRPGWVEHDASEIWQSCLAVLREALSRVEISRVAAIGIANQRETVVVWDRSTGEPVGPAIVWQDRRTAGECERMRTRGAEPAVREKTGLRLDPYFSATKLAWILENRHPGPQVIAGTIDSWLLWNLTAGRLHATDVSNASRTLLFDLDSCAWSSDLCSLFGIPEALLPEVFPTAADFGPTDPRLFGRSIPIRAVVGDQQGALFGQGCFEAGDSKATYGTGLFLMSQAGRERPRSEELLATLAWDLGDGPSYALEGSAFVAGAAVAWLRDGLGILESVEASDALARSIPGNGGVFFVPALAGLGTPHWDPAARGLFIGLTRGTGRAEIVRAVLESIAYQTREILDIFRRDLRAGFKVLKTDGGATRNDFLLQFQADLLGVPVARAEVSELTALGAAGIAGVSAGVFSSASDFAGRKSPGTLFEPAKSAAELDPEYERWRAAVARSRSWA
ncbi:MAG: glycerol kinase GlpK [Thermoanaerobaculia bacterium]